jgi:jumonji domain-containing protein 7
MDEALELLSDDVSYLWACGPSVPQIPASELTALRFHREFVSQSRPVVVTGLVDHWTTALQSWQDDDYLCSATSKDPEISVNVTPTGWGDCIHRVHGEEIFIRPEQRQMKLSTFLSILKSENGTFDGVPYISYQNDSLRTQFSSLMKDVDDVLPLAREAFNSMPDATNLWMGDERAVSSLHKDHYENMYVVVHGEKHFLLFPPADVAFLENGIDDQNFRTARFIHRHVSAIDESNGSNDDETHAHEFEMALPLTDEKSQSQSPLSTSWRVVVDEDGSTTPWVRPWDELTGPPPRTSPVEVIVKKGQVLYLPALWYHQVSQRGKTIAVNYWHDMTFDHKWIYHNFLRNAVKSFRVRKDQMDEEELLQEP